jgi:transposase
MDEMKKEKIGLFRFRVIAPLIGLKNEEWGKKEALVADITKKEWDITFSGRSYIGRSTVLEWLKSYEESGEKLESLYPKERRDRGVSRVIDAETEKILLNLRKELRGATLPTILKIARERKLLPPDFRASAQSVYRLFKAYGFEKEESPKDRRRFEAELPNDL